MPPTAREGIASILIAAFCCETPTLSLPQLLQRGSSQLCCVRHSCLHPGPCPSVSRTSTKTSNAASLRNTARRKHSLKGEGQGGVSETRFSPSSIPPQHAQFQASCNSGICSTTWHGISPGRTVRKKPWIALPVPCNPLPTTCTTPWEASILPCHPATRTLSIPPRCRLT